MFFGPFALFLGRFRSVLDVSRPIQACLHWLWAGSLVFQPVPPCPQYFVWFASVWAVFGPIAALFVGFSVYFDRLLWLVVSCIIVVDYLAYLLLLLHWLVSSFNIMATKLDIVPSAPLVIAPMTFVKLNGKNYVYWVWSVEVFLKGKCLYDHLTLDKP